VPASCIAHSIRKAIFPGMAAYTAQNQTDFCSESSNRNLIIQIPSSKRFLLIPKIKAFTLIGINSSSLQKFLREMIRSWESYEFRIIY
jgi:hypothetical protein